MKTTQSNYNPLSEILELFPTNNQQFLTMAKMEQVRNLLDLGGVHCESPNELLGCLMVLRDQGLLNMEEWAKKTHFGREVSYIITRNT